MLKGKIKSIVNNEMFIWYGLEPSNTTLSILDRIAIDVDENYHEGIINKKQIYKDSTLKRFTHSYKNKPYAISIFNKDAVDFVLFKNSLAFKKILKLMNERFEFPES